ncbi:MAG: response regulator [Verrucomicrobia bacterium]|nr:response regulator [Verrucomicrobiota bacterium]
MKRGSETLLVVEDDPTVRSLVAVSLRESGYTVLEAMDGEEAVRMAASLDGQLDLLLCDVVLPGMNGKDVVDRIRAAHPAVAALFISGYTNITVAHQGILEAGLPCLQKPFQPGELADKVRELLDARGGAVPGGSLQAQKE